MDYIVVGTGVVCAVVVDTVRLPIYGLPYLTTALRAENTDITELVIVATLSAFVGAYLGTRILKTVTLRLVQIVVALTMMSISVGLGGGLIWTFRSIRGNDRSRYGRRHVEGFSRGRFAL